ncbi:MAG: IS3 family transposase [Jatrophihabitantaceae bacterium]
MSARCALVEAEKATYKIAWMCTLLGVARSSFYAWRSRVETPTAARRRQLAELITQAFAASRQVHGCRRIARDLNDAGHEVSVGTVATIMRQLGLRAVQPRAYKRTTVPGEAPVPAPDLINRDFAPGGTPGRRFVGDITYLKTNEGWLYLATVIDLATRMVVGWQTAEHMRTSLVTDALQMGIDARLIEPDAIFHSDYAESCVMPRIVGIACAGRAA